MKIGSSLSLPRATVKLAKPKLLSAPKALKPKAPKLVKISLQPAKTSTGGWAAKAIHHMSDGTSSQFNFTDPMSFGKHLAKITRGEWRHPGKNEAPGIVHNLDIG